MCQDINLQNLKNILTIQHEDSYVDVEIDDKNWKLVAGFSRVQKIMLAL